MSTYTPIASQTLSSTASTITFTSIPQTYTDLILVTSAFSSSVTGIAVQFNNDTGNNYSVTLIDTDGTTATSNRTTNASKMQICGWSTTLGSTTKPSIATTQIMNYSNATTYKSAITRAQNYNSSTGNSVDAIVGLWRSTAAITSMTLLLDTGTFASGSTFNLYGIANAGITNVAKATGGNSVYTDGTYWYHTFLSSGTFTPTQNLTADYLVVAGGGGGGRGNTGSGGGGGAGGLRCSVGATGGGGTLGSALSLTAQAYAVTVGAGGAGGSSPTSGVQGSASGFSTVSTTGGGYGAGANVAGGNGGSGGGGGGRYNGGTENPGTGTANEGYAGGISFNQINVGPAGGGGGAGAVGSAGSSSKGGDGGAGVTTSISGSSVTYAGGGGGGVVTGTAGSGGNGGGGAGATQSAGSATAGTANTGGGGGGTANSSTGSVGANGGSGIVIVRYAV